jgi:hypothetical protein
MSPLVTAWTGSAVFVPTRRTSLRTPLTQLSTRAQLLERALRRRDATFDEHAESQALVPTPGGWPRSWTTCSSRPRWPTRRPGASRSTRRLGSLSVDAAGPHAAEQGVQVTGPAPVGRRSRSSGLPAAAPGAPTPDRQRRHSHAGRRSRQRRGHRRVEGDRAGVDDGTASTRPWPALFDRFAHGPGTSGRRHFGPAWPWSARSCRPTTAASKPGDARRRRHLHRHTPPHGGIIHELRTRSDQRRAIDGAVLRRAQTMGQDYPVAATARGPRVSASLRGGACSSRRSWLARGWWACPGAGDRKPWRLRSGPVRHHLLAVGG